MAILLSKMKTSEDLLQRCKVNVWEVDTGVVFSFYMADMRVCYTDDLTVWAT